MVEADRRTVLVKRLAAHLLAHGLAGASLRPMAAAAGTSDRMLLYYFADREALLAAVLEHVAADMASALDALVPATPLPAAALIKRGRAALREPGFRPYMSLWLEVAARAGRDEAPYRAIGERIGLGFLAWIDARLTVPGGRRRAEQAALVLATIDGLALLDAVGLAAMADAAVG